MASGYGSIYYVKARGVWVAAAEVLTPTGKRKRKTFTARTEAEARARLDRWRADNPTPFARDRAAGSHSAEEWFAVQRASGGACHYCGRRTTTATPRGHATHRNKDHRVPLIRGGTDDIGNIVVACRSCNVEKGRMTDAEYIAWKAARVG